MGCLLNITVSGGEPNATVTVTLDNGIPPGDPLSIQESFPVVLDANGDGQKDWVVPSSGWGQAKINTPGAQEIGVVIRTV
jgi:hypothetical protein